MSFKLWKQRWVCANQIRLIQFTMRVHKPAHSPHRNVQHSTSLLEHAYLTLFILLDVHKIYHILSNVYIAGSYFHIHISKTYMSKKKKRAQSLMIPGLEPGTSRFKPRFSISTVKPQMSDITIQLRSDHSHCPTQHRYLVPGFFSREAAQSPALAGLLRSHCCKRVFSLCIDIAASAPLSHFE